MEYNFIKDNKYNFWKQQDPQPFDYNTDYKKNAINNIRNELFKNRLFFKFY